MNEEELFCKLFPEYAVNGKPLSPYFDLFERGYEEAENRIEELEKACEETQELLDKQIESTYKLDKENAELKEINSETLAQLNLDNGELITELTKAKTYLKYFIEILKKLGANKEPLVIEAEQFLKDSEVEK